MCIQGAETLGQPDCRSLGPEVGFGEIGNSLTYFPPKPVPGLPPSTRRFSKWPGDSDCMCNGDFPLSIVSTRYSSTLQLRPPLVALGLRTCDWRAESAWYPRDQGRSTAA